ncbi:669_t:CDS:2 [Paraglomus occultum]|uniref:669_t:CDS:1 n=1 Tax=Paraglomus occultum TaxID=144539 RepID=A0A9N9BEQ0_9GLOM|nr:669_t:CDS:2 [Paraglomus occultum]
MFLTYPQCAMEKEDVLKELLLKVDISVTILLQLPQKFPDYVQT